MYDILVDEQDKHLLDDYTWYVDTRRHYVSRSAFSRTVYLHRVIMDAKEGEHVDHINSDRLDNRRSNLRICTQDQNNKNVPSKGAYPFRGKWKASITHNYKQIHLGVFDTEDEAKAAFAKARDELRGEFAYVENGEAQHEHLKEYTDGTEGETTG